MNVEEVGPMELLFFQALPLPAVIAAQ